MARSIDSDYIDLSLMGIDLDGFEENMKRIMELPIKYLDSAHDKAVELMEDVHAMLWDPFPDGEVQNKLQPSKDQSSSNVITGSSSTSVGTKLVGENETPTSLISMENDFMGCTNMDAHETESVLTKRSKNTSSEGYHIDANDLCLFPEDSLTTEVYDSTTSEEIILWNPENFVRPPRLPEPATISKHLVPYTLDKGKVTEQIGFHGSSHAETMSHDLSTDVSRCTDDSTAPSDDTAKSVSICHRNVQENMKNDNFEEPYIYLRQNTSFKKMFMRNLSSKLRWSKKQTRVQQAVPPISQDGENLGYQLVSSSDDLDDDWEVL